MLIVRHMPPSACPESIRVTAATTSRGSRASESRGAVSAESIDQRVKHARGVRVEMALQGGSAATHPIGGGRTIGSITRSESVGPVRPNQLAVAAVGVLKDDRYYRLARDISVGSCGYAAFEPVSDGRGETGEGFQYEFVRAVEVVGPRAQRDGGSCGQLSTRGAGDADLRDHVNTGIDDPVAPPRSLQRPSHEPAVRSRIIIARALRYLPRRDSHSQARYNFQDVTRP